MLFCYCTRSVMYCYLSPNCGVTDQLTLMHLQISTTVEFTYCKFTCLHTCNSHPKKVVLHNSENKGLKSFKSIEWWSSSNISHIDVWNKCKEKLVILQLIGIVVIKSKEIRVVTYNCRYSSGHLVPNSF